jgi:purine-nucleoside phosphorylase
MVMAEGAAGSLYERAEHAARVIRARTKLEPRIAIVLGSGLGSFADEFDEAVGIPYSEIPGFKQSTVAGHAGQLVVGSLDSVPLVAMQGRVHYDPHFQIARRENVNPDECFGWN